MRKTLAHLSLLATLVAFAGCASTPAPRGPSMTPAAAAAAAAVRPAAPNAGVMQPIPDPEPAARPAPPPKAAPVRPSGSARAAPKADAPRIDTSRAAQLRAQGLESLNRGSVDQAINLLQQAKTLDPGNALIQRDLERALRISRAVKGK